MKNNVKRILASLAALGMCLPLAAGCNQTGGGDNENPGDVIDVGITQRPENDFLQDPDRVPDRVPFVDNTPEESEDAVLTPYRFEAEKATVIGSTNGTDHFCTGKSIEFSPDFSGNVTLCNLGTAKISFKFNSDKAVRSKFYIRMANQYYGSTNGVLSSYANITVNGKPVVDLSASFEEDAGETASGSSSSYFKMCTVESKISLAEGRNVLEITPATANYLNLDYIEINTSAEVEDLTVPTVENPSSFVKVNTVPTAEKTGKIAFDCHSQTTNNGVTADCPNDNQRGRTLPVLTNDIYTEKTVSNGTQHVIEMFGKDVVISSTVTYNLTLQNATFADGSVSGKVAPGDTPEIKYETPSDSVFSHWEDADGNNLGTKFVMPEKDITIKPVFTQSGIVTVTLQGATLDGRGTVTALGGTDIDLSGAVFTDQPDGTVLRYWYNVADESEFYDDVTAVPVPTGNVTLAPAFDLATYANRDGSTVGKLATFPYYGYADFIPGGSVQPKDGYIRNVESSGVSAKNAYWGFVGTGEDREMGAIYHWKGVDGNLAKGFSFTPLSPYKVVGTNKYTITYTVQNNGDKEISLKIYQTNSSGNFKPSATATEEFTLAAGETKSLQIAFSNFSNGNLMTTIELLSEGISDLKLGMYQYIAITQ